MRQVTVPAREENLPRVVQALDDALEEAGCDVKTAIKLQLAVEEIFVNIARYAYAGGAGDVSFEVWMDAEPRRLSMRFGDAGVPYNPLERDEPDVTLSTEEREIGGLGIFLARKNVDEMRYEYREGQNILTMSKRL